MTSLPRVITFCMMVRGALKKIYAVLIVTKCIFVTVDSLTCIIGTILVAVVVILINCSLGILVFAWVVSQ